MPDEADRVRQRVVATVRRLRTTHCRVERREQRILDEHAGTREPVEQRRLAGVGVAGDDDARDGPTSPLLPLHLASGLHAGDLAAQLRAALTDPPTVGLDLRLTRTAGADPTTPGDAATCLPGQRLTPPTKSRQHVLHLRELHLRLAF